MLGCTPMDERPTDIPTLKSSGILLSESDCVKLLTYAGRPDDDVLFPPENYIRRQVNNGCNGFSTAAALTRQRVKRGCDPVVLSGDFIYATMSGNRDMGSMLHEGRQNVMKYGVAPDDMVKVGTYRWNDISAAAKEAALRFRGFEAYEVPTYEELLTAVALGYMCVVAIHVDNSYMKVDSNGLAGPSNRGPGNHSVLVSDARVRDGKIEFKSPGSWGLNYAVRGSVWLTWQAHLQTTTKNHQFWALRTTSDDPQEKIAA